jgi:cytochrome P450
MEQHVDDFEATVKDAATKLGVKADEIKAKLLGRYPDGAPATLGEAATAVNTFDYAPSWEHPKAEDDSDGKLCPIGAHIRRTNPRSARVAGTSHSRRLIRRGMPANWKEGGAEHKGLLGLFICADIERQFEFIQRQWIQGDLAAAGIRGSQDPIAGLREGTTPFAIGDEKIEVPPLTTTRGCLYLFYPSLSVLKQFTKVDVTPTEAPDNQPKSFEFFGLSASKIKAALLKTTQNLPDNLADEFQGLVQSLIFNTAPNSPRISQIVDSAVSTRKSIPKPEGVPVANFDPLSQEFLRDPYSYYAEELRLGNQIVWVPQHNACWVLSYDLCKALLKKPDEFFQSESYSKVKGIISLDKPRHTEVRSALEKAFTQLGAFSSATDKAKEERSLAIDSAVASALERIQGLEQFDFVRDYSDAISRDVFWGMYGIPDTEKEIFDALARRMMRHFSQPQRDGWSDALVFADASAKLAGRIALRVAKLWAFNHKGNTAKILTAALANSFGLESANEKEASANNLIANLTRQIPSTIKTLEDDTDGVSFVECVATLLQLVLAGYMPIQFLLGTTAMNVIKGNAWNNGLDVENTLQEGRRFEPSVTIVQRFAKEGAQLCGFTFPKDCAVHAVVASANRNGATPNNLNSFDPTRAAFAHLSLGHGVHQCVGSWLQAQIAPKALNAILEAAPNLKLRQLEATPAWFDNIYFRGLESLPVQRG